MKKHCTDCHRTECLTREGRWVPIRLKAGICQACREAYAEIKADDEARASA